MRAAGDVAFHSDEDGDLWLHTDDPGSTSWRVVVVERDASRHTPTREENRIGSPTLGYEVAFSAWSVGRNFCHVEVSDERGAVRLIGPCGHSPADAPQALPCDRCGAPVAWLVAMMYAPDTSPAGRLLKYCDRCRRDAGPHVGMVIPWSMFEVDRERLLELMYRGDATETEPDAVALHLSMPEGRWMKVARQVLVAKRHQTAPPPQ